MYTLLYMLTIASAAMGSILSKYNARSFSSNEAAYFFLRLARFNDRNLSSMSFTFTLYGSQWVVTSQFNIFNSWRKHKKNGNKKSSLGFNLTEWHCLESREWLWSRSPSVSVPTSVLLGFVTAYLLISSGNNRLWLRMTLLISSCESNTWEPKGWMAQCVSESYLEDGEHNWSD